MASSLFLLPFAAAISDDLHLEALTLTPSQPSSPSSSAASDDDSFVPVFRSEPHADPAAASSQLDPLDRRRQFLSIESDLFVESGSDYLDLGFDDDGDEAGLPIRWDCLQLEEEEEEEMDRGGDEFEWEEVPPGDRSEETRVMEWEVVPGLAARNPVDDPVETVDGDDESEGFVYTSGHHEAYDVLVGDGGFLKGRPPAAKSAVEGLASIVLSERDVGEGDTECAVCKDGILGGDRVKRLPCGHHFHDECILPWLEMRNSCPLCRYELPTDDPEYESWKARQVGVAV